METLAEVYLTVWIKLIRTDCDKCHYASGRYSIGDEDARTYTFTLWESCSPKGGIGTDSHLYNGVMLAVYARIFGMANAPIRALVALWNIETIKAIASKHPFPWYRAQSDSSVVEEQRMMEELGKLLECDWGWNSLWKTNKPITEHIISAYYCGDCNEESWFHCLYCILEQ